MPFDPACFNLACHFLPTSANDRLKLALAQAIQNAVEDWIECEKSALEAKLKGEPNA